MEKKSTYGLTPEQLGRLLSVASEEADLVDSMKGKGGKAKPPGPAGRKPQIEGYEVLGKLGEAGQGQIWRALQVSTSREVALKIPRAGLISSEKALARFEREVELAAALKHQNIVQIHDSGIHQGIYYYAMDLIEGMHLDEYVKQHHLTTRQRLELMQTVCQAVQHAHQNGVIHRDLKPSNIIVTAEGIPYVVDFGLAKNLLEDDVALTVSIDGEAAGTPAYMSPEQAAGHIDKLDTRTDVYSLGVILFALLTGEYPHDLSGSRLEVMRRIAEEETRRPRKICPKVDKELEFLLLKALANDPDKRYTTAGELARDIDNYLRRAPLIAGPESGMYHIKKFVKRHQTLVAGIAALLAILTAGVIVSMLFAIGQARARAEAQAINNFLTNELLASTNPFGGFRELTVLSVLDGIAWRLEDEFEDRPLVKASILHSLGKAYWWHGKAKEAEGPLEQALRIYQEKLGEKSPKTLEPMFWLGLVYRGQGRDQQAQSLYHKVIEGMCRHGGEKGQVAFSALNELAQMGIEQYRSDAYEKAVATLASVERFRNMLGDEAQVSEIAFLAMALHKSGHKQEGQATFDQLLGLLEGPGRANADFIFATPTNIGPPVNSSENESFPCLSADGLSLYFGSHRQGVLGEHDLYVTTRQTKTDPWGPAVNLGPKVNSSYSEWAPRLSANDLSLFFGSNRPGGYGNWDVWVARRTTIDDDWGKPVNLGPNVNGPGDEGPTIISADGLSLFITSWNRPGGYGAFDAWVTTRASIKDDWGESVNLGPPVNTSASEFCTGLSADELSLFFSAGFFGPARPGGAGGGDLWISTRSAKGKPWSEPVNLGPTINSWADEVHPYISADGSTLYFTSARPDGFGNGDLWQVSLVPIVDTNGNGKVDLDDLCNLAQRTSDVD